VRHVALALRQVTVFGRRQAARPPRLTGNERNALYQHAQYLYVYADCE
jgi:hypothetical protein